MAIANEMPGSSPSTSRSSSALASTSSSWSTPLTGSWSSSNSSRRSPRLASLPSGSVASTARRTTSKRVTGSAWRLMARIVSRGDDGVQRRARRSADRALGALDADHPELLLELGDDAVQEVRGHGVDVLEAVHAIADVTD